MQNATCPADSDLAATLEDAGGLDTPTPSFNNDRSTYLGPSVPSEEKTVNPDQTAGKDHQAVVKDAFGKPGHLIILHDSRNSLKTIGHVI